ncbi:MAG: phenylalanine--tRNA ligase beta subunit-related protein [Jatrophihabitantaceae bacterium]
MPVIFTLSRDVSTMFPEAQIRLVAAHGLRNPKVWPEAEAALRGLEEDLAAGTWAPFGEEDPQVLSWHEAFRKFGTNPRRLRSSMDALSRRMAKSGALPRISGAVDAYNCVSVRFGTPAGAFDLSRLTGEVMIRLAVAGDTFTPLGEPDVTEEPRPGEVVYALGSQVLTRHWNHRDCDQTKVEDTSGDVVFVIERVSAEAVPDDVLQSAQQALSEMLAGHAESVSAATLDAEQPTATVD